MPDGLIAAGPGNTVPRRRIVAWLRRSGGDGSPSPVNCRHHGQGQLHRKENRAVIILGLLLLLTGWLTGISLLYTVGSIVLIVGIVFFILGNVGRPVGGRKVWF
jgi:hypothetical protein